MKYRMLAVVWVAVAAAAPWDVLAQAATDDPDPYAVQAYRLSPDDVFILDGRLDEPFWQYVNPITNFRQQQPDEGGVPSQRTEIFIAYDNQNLYIGARLHDTAPDRILAYQRRRNQSLATDDRFMWILDTFHDGRNAYFFETNPAGLLGDGLLTIGQGMNLNKAWDGIWNVRTNITDNGWTVEVQIPFRTLDFNPDNSTWGINFQRTVRRTNEEIVWSGWRQNEGLFRPQNAGILTGLEGLDQGLGLEAIPYVTGSANRSWPSDDIVTEHLTADTGFDLSYNITPSIRTSLTINTDFAETEVDQRRVNLTRFPISFPEQRDFFLAGASIFSFAPASGITPVFSRRIGLVEGDQIPLQGGLRVLGRQNQTNVGFYQIRTGRKGDVPSEDFTAARISQNILDESSVGLIYTRRSTHGDNIFTDRHTLGADLELNTSRFLGDKVLQFQAFFVWHNPNTITEVSGFWDRTSRGIRIEYPNYPLYGQLSYREFGEAFNPAVGFAPRVAFRRFQPTIGYRRILGDHPVLRSWDTSLRFEYLTDLDLNPQDVNLTFTPVDFRFESGERISAGIRRDFEHLPFDFDILRDGSIIIPKGNYHTWQYGADFSTASYRRLAASAAIAHDGFWTGNRVVYEFSLTTRPLPGINLSAIWSRTDASLAEGDFQTDLVRFNGNVDLTPWTAFTSIIQYDTISEVLGLYHRFRWTIRPGADLYLVYTYNWIQSDYRFRPIETEGAVKLSFAHRF